MGWSFKVGEACTGYRQKNQVFNDEGILQYEGAILGFSERNDDIAGGRIDNISSE